MSGFSVDNLRNDHIAAAMLGRVNPGRAGTPGPRFMDAQGNDVTSADARFVGAIVSGRDGEVAIITITGAGQQATNNAGIALEYGDVVVLDTDGSVTTTTTPQDTRPVGVVQIGGADGQPVVVQFSGFVSRVNCIATVTAGNYGETSSTDGRATENATLRIGSFCQFLASSATPSAYLFGSPKTASSASGGEMVPYYIPVDETFTVPVYRQALFYEPIEVDGALVVNGLLQGVD